MVSCPLAKRAVRKAQWDPVLGRPLQVASQEGHKGTAWGL